MIRDITLGQYYSVDSPIHRRDPRVKILAVIIYIAAIFVVGNYMGFLACALSLVLVIAMSKVPAGFILRGLKPVIFILVFTFSLNIFMIDGKVLWHFGFLEITDRGLYTAVFMSIKLILLILGTSILTFTTTPIKLTDGIEKLLWPFSKVGLPTHDIAMMMSIALRFIPTLMEETDKIIKAQQARGADFESGNIFRRAKALVPILVPLFVSAFRIALDLAMAMEARCYSGGKGRTRMNEMRLNAADILFLAINALFLGLIITLRIVFL